MIGALANANPLGGMFQAMKGLGDMLKNAGSFMEKLTQMPPNPMGAMMDFCKMCKGAQQAQQGVQNATGLQMDPMQMLKNMLGIGQQGGGGGGGGGQSPLGQMMDGLPSPFQMMQPMQLMQSLLR
jgi:hypothetical protein